MDLKGIIQSRRSIRAFQNRAVSKSDVTKILDAARHAPSSGNCQNWKFIVVNKNREKAYNSSLGQKFLLEAPVLVIVCAEHKATEKYGKRSMIYSIQNTAAAIQNMLLMAESLGISSCWVGAFDHEKISREFSIPDGVEPVAVIALGYAGEKRPAPLKKSLETLVFFEQWGKK